MYYTIDAIELSSINTGVLIIEALSILLSSSIAVNRGLDYNLHVVTICLGA